MVPGRNHREFRTGLRPTSVDERYVTFPFIITSKIKELPDSFFLGVSGDDCVTGRSIR